MGGSEGEGREGLFVIGSMGESPCPQSLYYWPFKKCRGPQVKGLFGTIEKQIKAVKHIPPDYDKIQPG